MKYKTTQKAVRNGYWKTIVIGYCDAQHLLAHKSANAYTCGVYGWNADIYDFDNIAIVTGYRPFGNVHPDYNTIREYEKRAEAADDWNVPYDERKRNVNAILEEFIDKVARG